MTDTNKDRISHTGKMRRRDGADELAEKLFDLAEKLFDLAEKLFDLVRNGVDDQKVINAIAAELRKAAQGPRKSGVLR